ncbi:MAG: hypothetical protein LBR43_01505 [Spiroplasmataceae bacterium]|jgi:hypothetical protein|nr:hypothetical protein [Spiroplasmataceae bacterium]
MQKPTNRSQGQKFHGSLGEDLGDEVSIKTEEGTLLIVKPIPKSKKRKN